MTARQSAGHGIVAVPVDLGQALAFPGVYLEPPAGLPGAALAPRVARPGRVGRTMAALASVAVAAGLALAGCGTTAHAAVRPAWDGRHPAVWVSPADPVCWRAIAGRHGWARAGGHGPWFRVACQRDGHEYVWGIA